MTVATEIFQGTLIDGRYRIQRILGQGGFGRTYLVSDERRFDEFCVLKEFIPHMSAASIVQKAKELFQREAKILYELNHPQIPKFIAWFEENGRLFLVQQYIDGKTYAEILSDRLAQGQTFTEAEVIQWLTDLLPVLDYLHSCQIVHRDISPDNIMLPTQGERPALIDLGVVKQVMSEVRSGSLRSTVNTDYALLVGKVGYSPSEQIDRGQCYPSSDLYALAVSALVLLTGKQPDEQDSLDSWLGHEIKISDRLAQILTKMLAEIPTQRYQSAKEVLRELQQSQSDSSPLIPAEQQQEQHQPTLIQTKTILQDDLLSQPLMPSPRRRRSFDLLSLPMSAIASGVIATILILGGLSLSLFSPYITVLCKTLDNCARDKEFQAIYTKELEAGKQAILEIDRAQSTKELQNIRERLGTSAIRLSTIPEDATVYAESRRVLRSYQTYLTTIRAKLIDLERTEEQLATIDQLSQEATQQSDTANTLAQYENAKAGWEGVQQRLKAIPSDTIAQEQVQTQLAQANNNVKSLQTEIEQRLAQAEQKIEKVARQSQAPKTSQTSLSPSPTVAPKPTNVTSSPPPRQQVTKPIPKTDAPVKPTNNIPAQSQSVSRPIPEPEQPITNSPTPPTTQPTSELAANSSTESVTARIASFQETERDVFIRYANDLAYGLVVAQQKKQIGYGSRTYRRVQTAIRLLRRGRSLEQATASSGVPESVIKQLIAWGQYRPSARTNEAITQEVANE